MDWATFILELFGWFIVGCLMIGCAIAALLLPTAALVVGYWRIRDRKHPPQEAGAAWRLLYDEEGNTYDWTCLTEDGKPVSHQVTLNTDASWRERTTK